jgi:hypothetical protein
VTVIRDRIVKRIHPAILLLAVTVLAYGLLLPQLGFYWDELPMTWIRYELGPGAMTRYFSTNRPVWGLLYQVTTRLLPQIPIYWQVFALTCRWLSALLVWSIVKHLWRDRQQLAIITSLCFLLYPGFSQQWTSYLYGHFFVVLCFLLLSFLCMLWSLDRAGWYWPLTGLGMAFSALNLWMMEYFYVLELFRPFLIFQVVSGQSGHPLGFRLRRTFGLWVPYLAVFAANVAWRLLVFNNQIYQPTLIPGLRAAPLTATLELLKTVGFHLYTVSVAAWAQIFSLPNPMTDGPRTLLFYVAVVLASAVVIGIYLSGTPRESAGPNRVAGKAMGLGLIAMLAAGGPFWLTGLDVTLAFPANRFTLPFMLGVALFVAGLLEWLPSNARIVAAVVFLCMAAGRQALLSDSYRRDWATQKAMFWQMLWRAPAIAPHTTLLLNQGAFLYYADNSLTGPLNWIYDPGNRDPGMDYVLFYPTSRLGGTLQGFEAGQPINYDFIAEVFTGNTSQTLAFYYQPPACLRLLDPALDSENHFVPDTSLMRQAAALSSTRWISSEATGHMPQIYGPEPPHGWCYYFEKADLAGQLGDWTTVVQLGDSAFKLNDYPNDPIERFVFIEGYARTGDWAKALDLSATSYRVSKTYVGPLLCRLWNRIRLGTPASLSRSAALDQVKRLFACTSE